ncbi:MAG: DUF2442 domain-containing protein [Chthoniobacterales bacterium]|jgi:Protein of unknown function (DUF2442)|nr:DUF2442 domain-containing protein [Chthoniobacterales bacterium]
MTHPIHRVVGCECVAPYSLRLRFDDELETTVDLAEVLEGEIYGPLRDPFLFARVAVDPEIGTVVWPNGADFDPSLLHDWPMHREAFVAAAKRWKSQMTARVAEKFD